MWKMDVTSLEDAQMGAYESVIDPACSFLRIKPGKTMTTPPCNPEELRMRHRRLGLAWEMLQHFSRPCLPERCLDGFRKLSDHILGDRIAGLWSPDGRYPSWSLVPQYESEVRKRAYCLVRDGHANDLNVALASACVALELYAMHFIGPFTSSSFGNQGDFQSGTGDLPWRKRARPDKGDVIRSIKKHSCTAHLFWLQQDDWAQEKAF